MKKRIKEIEKEIDRLDEIVDKLSDDHFKKETPPSEADLQVYQNLGRNEFRKMIKLEIELSLLTPFEWEELPTYGDLFTIESWLGNVECGGFIDYDGYGNYATKDKMSNKEIRPSHVKKFPIRDTEFTHIVWFNR